PEHTVLYRTVEAHLPTFLAQTDGAAERAGLPGFGHSSVECAKPWSLQNATGLRRNLSPRRTFLIQTEGPGLLIRAAPGSLDTCEHVHTTHGPRLRCRALEFGGADGI